MERHRPAAPRPASSPPTAPDLPCPRRTGHGARGPAGSRGVRVRPLAPPDVPAAAARGPARDGAGAREGHPGGHRRRPEQGAPPGPALHGLPLFRRQLWPFPFPWIWVIRPLRVLQASSSESGSCLLTLRFLTQTQGFACRRCAQISLDDVRCQICAPASHPGTLLRCKRCFTGSGGRGSESLSFCKKLPGDVPSCPVLEPRFE